VAKTAGGNWKALYQAARSGNLNDLDEWLGHDLDLDYQHNEFGTTVLIAAAEVGHRAICERLVAAGASLDVVSEWDGCTAQQAAREHGHGSLAMWLEQQPRARK
jgi:ankyrin repeat protein